MNDDVATKGRFSRHMWFIAALGTAFFFLVFAALILRRAPPEGKTWFDAMFGTAGIMPALFGLLTIAGAVVTIFYLAKRDRNDDRMFRLGVMKESANLIGGKSDTARVSGLYMIASLAAQNPSEVAPVGLRTITSFLIEATAETWDLCRDIIDGGNKAPPPEKRSTVAVVEALAIIGELREYIREWPEIRGYSRDRLRTGHFYVGHVELAGRNYTNCDFVDVIAEHLTFSGCDFTDATMRIITSTRVTFKGCNITNFKLEAFDFSKQKIGVEAVVGHLSFDACTGTNAKLHGVPIPSTGMF